MNESKNILDEKKLDKNEKISDREKNISAKFYTLNKQFMLYLQCCYDANKNADFTPVLKDYIGYSSKIQNQETFINIPSFSPPKKDVLIPENTVLKNSFAQNFPQVRPPVISSSETKSCPTSLELPIVSLPQPSKTTDFFNKSSFIPNPIVESSSFSFNFPPSNYSAKDTLAPSFPPQNVAQPVGTLNFGTLKTSIIPDACDTQAPKYLSSFPSSFTKQNSSQQQVPGLILPPFSSAEIFKPSTLSSNPFLSSLSIPPSTGAQFFGSAQPQASLKSSVPSVFGFPQSEDPEQGEEVDPDCQASDMGYEPSAICSIRAKLFYLKNEKYCEMGVGIFNIKAIESDSQHLQLIFRLESSRSGSVLMNIKITKKPTNVTIQKDKNLIITSLPNPPIQQVTGDESFSDQMLVVSYLVKTKTVSDMKNILDAINLDF